MQALVSPGMGLTAQEAYRGRTLWFRIWRIS